MANDSPVGLAKITWRDPSTGEARQFVLSEGATITIGRNLSNEICIREEHVSRQHAVINYQYGLFMISDLGSANGTFVNGKPVTEPYPLTSGDVIRLYVPELQFHGSVTAHEAQEAKDSGTFILPPDREIARPKLMITAVPVGSHQEGHEFILSKDTVTLGRAVENAAWDIRLEDKAVSRPHARIERNNNAWAIIDLNSANKTFVNNKMLTPHEPVNLNDGAVLVLGQTTMLFRLSE